MKQWNFYESYAQLNTLNLGFINELNRPAVRNFSEKSYLYHTVSYSILSTNIDIVKAFCVLQNKVALLTQEMFWAGNKKLSSNSF